jgi:hypothetical protein
VKLRARSVHAKVEPLRAVDLAPVLRREAALAGPAKAAYLGYDPARPGSDRAAVVTLNGRTGAVIDVKPTAAPATPHVFAVGQSVRVTGNSGGRRFIAHCHSVGDIGEVLKVDPTDDSAKVRVRGSVRWVSWGELEPIPPTTAPAPAGEHPQDARRDAYESALVERLQAQYEARTPAPVGEREWRVGDRVCVKAHRLGHERHIGRVGVIVYIDGRTAHLPAPAVESERG